MADRYLEVIVPAGRREAVEKVLAEQPATWSWHHESAGRAIYRLLVPAERVEALLDPLQARLAGEEDFRVVVLRVEASLPRPPAEAEEASAETDEKPSPARVAREELYAALDDQARVTPVFLASVALSTVVAAIGLGRDNAAVVIGAMVIAPLLGPNMALSLATTLGDPDLGRRALRTSLAGMGLALAVALLLGWMPFVETGSSELAARADIGPADILLALAAGAAGALAFTAGVSAALVGVMVAVALLPPLVGFGIFLVRGDGRALPALLLLAVNVICVNLAGVGVFLAQGIHPRTWWEAERSKRRSRRALALWLGLLAVAAVLVWFAGG
ncbi:MAG: TIGR00341 family protein [Planctomycetota bacterium]|nr:MAG: TIGR00341 family protein [Planctomycetota bacterium]